jgi:hypothetical protein
MTAQPIAPAPVVGTDTDLITLAELYQNEEIDGFNTHLILLRLTPPQDEHKRWARFEDLCEAVRRRQAAQDGDWRAVDDDICGWDPSEAAFEQAQGEVDAAVNALLKGDQ